jgi:tetratricopeptide (TPR) repeat protein
VAPDVLVADYEKYVLLNPTNPRYLADGYNNLARLLATAPYDALRDGKKAVQYATKAAELTNWQDAKVLDTLAAAYAEAGNFDDAIKWENKALTFPEFAKNFGAVGGQRLQLYADKKPYREK